MMNEFYQKIKYHREILVVGLLVFISIFIFLFYSGTLTSGYHLIDDHGMVNIKMGLANNNFLDMVNGCVRNDLIIRFRPLYYVYYIFVVKLFGLNFLYISVFLGVLASFISISFYLVLRRFNYSIAEALFFIALVFMGTQAAVWWRLGTNEPLGIFFLALAFLSLANFLQDRCSTVNKYLFIIFLFLASISKESFIVIIPAFIFLKIWLEKNRCNLTIKQAIRKNYYLGYLLLIMIIELAIIKFVVGTNQIGYAGVTSSLAELFSGIKLIIFSPQMLNPLLILSGKLLLVFAFFWIFFLKDKKKILYSFLPYMIFAFLIVIPEILMHAKSGMAERYLLPTTIGLGFLILGILKLVRMNFFRFLIVILISIFIFNSFSLAYKNAVAFAEDGRKTGKLFSTVTDNAESDSKILFVADPVDRFEVSWSTKMYLSYYGRENFYAFPVEREYTTDFERNLRSTWLDWFKEKGLDDLNGLPDVIIVFDAVQKELFFDKSKILEKDYKNVTPEGLPSLIYVIKER